MEKVIDLNPYVILICVDTIDGDLKSVQRQDTVAIFEKFKSKFGVYEIMGNHE